MSPLLNKIDQIRNRKNRESARILEKMGKASQLTELLDQLEPKDKPSQEQSSDSLKAAKVA